MLKSIGNPLYFAEFQQIPAGIHHMKWIMWCSIKQPRLDSYSVENYSALNENLTCKDDGMVQSNIKNWQYASHFLRAKPCSQCIYALDIEFVEKKSILTIISMFDTKSGHWPPKLWKRVQASSWYARYPSAVWFTILHNSWDDVPNNQIVDSIVVSNVRYRDAQTALPDEIKIY